SASPGGGPASLRHGGDLRPAPDASCRRMNFRDLPMPDMSAKLPIWVRMAAYVDQYLPTHVRQTAGGAIDYTYMGISWAGSATYTGPRFSSRRSQPVSGKA
ncbi:MAG TPA: hypothetical protein VF096_00250, partial [Azonexus sp.]